MQYDRRAVAVIAATTMAVATFSQTIFGVLAADLIAVFDTQRWQIGILVTATGMTGALLSPAVGRLTDSLGSTRSVLTVLGAGMGGMVMIATAPRYWLLVAGALAGGIAQGWANPATNALVVDHVAAGARGIITGVKQSGVQMGAFLGGLLLPSLAVIIGWRGGVAVFLVFPVLATLFLWRLPNQARPVDAGDANRRPLPPQVKWLALYGALAGLGISATNTFLPLFAEEGQGWTTVQGGMLIAAVGLVGVVARIGWGNWAERLTYAPVLRYLAIQSAASTLLLVAAALEVIPSWVLIPAAVLFGSGALAWTAVGMLAVMEFSPPGLVGRGTGLINLGFLSGISLGAPLIGLSVDRLGVYAPGWLGVAALFGAGAFLAGRVGSAGQTDGRAGSVA